MYRVDMLLERAGVVSGVSEVKHENLQGATIHHAIQAFSQKCTMERELKYRSNIHYYSSSKKKKKKKIPILFFLSFCSRLLILPTLRFRFFPSSYSVLLSFLFFHGPNLSHEKHGEITNSPQFLSSPMKNCFPLFMVFEFSQSACFPLGLCEDYENKPNLIGLCGFFS